MAEVMINPQHISFYTQFVYLPCYYPFTLDNRTKGNSKWGSNAYYLKKKVD